MPRRSLADRINSSARYHRAQIRKAYEDGSDMDAPLTAAMRWLYAALAQKARQSPAEAHEAYRHATEQIAAYAETLQRRTADGKENTGITGPANAGKAPRR